MAKRLNKFQFSFAQSDDVSFYLTFRSGFENEIRQIVRRFSLMTVFAPFVYAKTDSRINEKRTKMNSIKLMDTFATDAQVVSST